MMKRLTIALVLMLTILAQGCAPSVSPKAKQKVQQVTDAGAVAVAKQKSAGQLKLQQTKDKNAVSAENGENAPVTHPIAAANYTIKKIRPWVIAIAVITGIGWIVQFALVMAGIKVPGFIGTFLRWTAILSLVAAFTLPVTLIFFFLMLCAVIALLVYELVKDRGDVPGALEDSEDVLGFRSSCASGGSLVKPLLK